MDFTAFKESQKATWSLGDFAEIAGTIRSVSELMIERSGVEPGDRVLDIGCGTGNLAIPAAKLGAIVTAIDLTPRMIEVARTEAEAAGLAIDFAEGDAEALAFADDSFDKVLSVLGMVFAPRHDLAATEMVRVCRPGGIVAIAAWTPGGMNGSVGKVMGRHMPKPPGAMKSPASWGDEDYVRAHFDDAIDWSFSHETAVFKGESVEQWLDYTEARRGPMVRAKRLLEPQGKWEALRADLIEHHERFNTATDGSFVGEADYLLAVGQLQA